MRARGAGRAVLSGTDSKYSPLLHIDPDLPIVVAEECSELAWTAQLGGLRRQRRELPRQGWPEMRRNAEYNGGAV